MGTDETAARTLSSSPDATHLDVCDSDQPENGPDGDAATLANLETAVGHQADQPSDRIACSHRHPMDADAAAIGNVTGLAESHAGSRAEPTHTASAASSARQMKRPAPAARVGASSGPQPERSVHTERVSTCAQRSAGSRPHQGRRCVPAHNGLFQTHARTVHCSSATHNLSAQSPETVLGLIVPLARLQLQDRSEHRPRRSGGIFAVDAVYQVYTAHSASQWPSSLDTCQCV